MECDDKILLEVACKEPLELKVVREECGVVGGEAWGLVEGGTDDSQTQIEWRLLGELLGLT